MTLQMKPTAMDAPHHVRYAPARDITWLYPNVMQTAENMLYDRRYEPLHNWLDEEGVTEEDLALTVEAYCKVLNAAHQNPEESLTDVMDRVGFSDMPIPAQVALTYYIGTMMAGTFFQGIRDVTPRYEDTTPEVIRLCKSGARMADYAARSPVGRWWIRMKRRLLPRRFQPWFTIGGEKA
jgi:hypothetical protein